MEAERRSVKTSALFVLFDEETSRRGFAHGHILRFLEVADFEVDRLCVIDDFAKHYEEDSRQARDDNYDQRPVFNFSEINKRDIEQVKHVSYGILNWPYLTFRKFLLSPKKVSYFALFSSWRGTYAVYQFLLL